MRLSNLLAAAAIGVMAFTSTAWAMDDKKKENRSSAFCRAISIGYSKVSNDKAIASAAADAATYLCGEDKGDASAEAIAEATAEAFALAVTAASAECTLEGDAAGYAQAYAKAEARAEVWLQAYAEVVASADVCKKCSAFVSFYAHVEKQVFLHALSESEASIDEYTDADRRSIAKKVFKVNADIKKAVATAFAHALAEARDDGDLAECYADGFFQICTGAEDDLPDCFECQGVAVSESEIEEIDALAVAIAGAVAYTCGDGYSIAAAKAVAKSVAEATATAISYVGAECYVEGQGYVCGFAEAEAVAVAKATALAFAKGWAKAISCKKCFIKVDATAAAIGKALAIAVSGAYADVCITSDGGTAAVELKALAAAVSKASVDAVAAAIAGAISTRGGFCAAVAGAGAGTG